MEEIQGDKQAINNYRPINNYCQFVEKYFERLIFNSVYQYLEEHKVLSADQSGFQANDSCVNQLLPIVDNIYSPFDTYPTLDPCGVFLDMRSLFSS